MSMPNTVIFGLDGAHFELIQEWIDSGELSNLETVLSDGVSGDLEAVLPPVTSPNWKAYATGKNPGKLGIFWWENIDIENERVYYPSDRKHNHNTFWQLLSEEMSVGVVGVPTTYPPSPINGFHVSGAPDGKNFDYSYPQPVEDELNNEFDYRVTKKYQLKDQRETAVSELLDLIDLRFRAARHLCEVHNVDFLQVTTFYINSLHHYLWDADATLEAWKIVDDHLGTYLDGETDIVLMSDHGSTEIRTVFNINTWLNERGYLSLSNTLSRGLGSLGINRDRLGRLAATLNLMNFAAKHMPSQLLDHLPDSDGAVNRESKMRNVNWGASDAIASGQGPIYLVMNRSNPRYDTVRNELRSALESVTGPNGDRIADAVHYAEDIYTGRYVEEGPDLVIDQSNGIHISGRVGYDDVFSSSADGGWRAENKRAGLFAAYGPSFNSGTVDGLSILDLAPTFLHMHGTAVPSQLDGDVRMDIFDDAADTITRDAETAGVDARSTELERVRRAARGLEQF